MPISGESTKFTKTKIYILTGNNFQIKRSAKFCPFSIFPLVSVEIISSRHLLLRFLRPIFPKIPNVDMSTSPISDFGHT